MLLCLHLLKASLPICAFVSSFKTEAHIAFRSGSLYPFQVLTSIFEKAQHNQNDDKANRESGNDRY